MVDGFGAVTAVDAALVGEPVERLSPSSDAELGAEVLEENRIPGLHQHDSVGGSLPLVTWVSMCRRLHFRECAACCGWAPPVRSKSSARLMRLPSPSCGRSGPGGSGSHAVAVGNSPSRPPRRCWRRWEPGSAWSPSWPSGWLGWSSPCPRCRPTAPWWLRLRWIRPCRMAGVCWPTSAWVCVGFWPVVGPCWPMPWGWAKPSRR